MQIRPNPTLQRLTAPLAMLVIAATLWGASDAHALTLTALKEGGCRTANINNISKSWPGTASTNGYTVDPWINAVSGALVIPASTTHAMDLPPDGVICVSALTCIGNYGILKFNRNEANTPVYLLVEGNVTMNGYCTINVDGEGQSARYGIGMDHVGGMGGPGGSDGGSCDFTFSNPPRAGCGVGPGGGAGSSLGYGGHGASPVSDGGAGASVNGGIGGVHYSAPEHRILHGGSGGGCGVYNVTPTAGNARGGGGGGGVFVMASGGTITFNAYSYIYARGGYGGNDYGGNGGGGVVRLIADVIVSPEAATSSYNIIDVTGYGAAGDGLIKLESPNVSGYFINRMVPPTAVYYGAQQEILPDAGVRPTLSIVSVDANYNGVPKNVTRTESDPSRQIHTVPGVFLEAPTTPEQVIVVHLLSNNVPFNAPIKVRMNTVYDLNSKRSVFATTVTPDQTSGSGVIHWVASLTVPAGMELGTIEAWVDNICTGTNCP